MPKGDKSSRLFVRKCWMRSRLPPTPPGKKPFQLPRSYRVLQFADGFGFHLPHAFAGDFEDSAYFFQRVGVAVADAVAELDDFALAIGERLEDSCSILSLSISCVADSTGLSAFSSSMKSPK